MRLHSFHMSIFTALLIAMIIMISARSVIGQEVWTLDRCIQFAIDHNLDIQQTHVDQESANITKKAARQLRYPSLNGNTNFDVSFGRQIDITTNDFNNQQFSSQFLSFFTQITLFNGGRISNQIKQASYNQEIAALNKLQANNDVALTVTQAYLEVLFAEENSQNAQKRIDALQAQLDQFDKFIEVGTQPENGRLDLVAQIAQGEQDLIGTLNDIDLAYISLKQSMQLAQSAHFKVEIPEELLPSNETITSLSAEDVFQKASGWFPSIKAGELSKESARLSAEIIRSNMVPSLTFGASMGSRYSSQAQRQGDQLGTRIDSEPVIFNGEPAILGKEKNVFEFNKIGYADQFNENLAYGVGLNLSIPIYNRGVNKANTEVALLDIERQTLANEQIKNDLNSAVQQAVANLKAGKKQFDAAERTLESMDAARKDAQKRFRLGVIDGFESIVAQNNYDQSVVNLSIAKYNYLFRLRIVEYFQQGISHGK